MPVRSTNSARYPAASIPQDLPELPHITAQLLEVPGMLEYNQQLQQWWDRFRRNSVFIQDNTDKRVREVSAVTADGLGMLTARIEDETELLANADAALALRASALEASVDTPTSGLLARVSVVESTYATQTFAEAKKTEAISASATYTDGEIGAVNANITTNYATKVYADGAASAAQSTAISTSNAYADGKVSTEASLRIAADGAIHARWGVAINVDGNVVGRINLDGTNQSSAFSIDVGKFTVANSSLGIVPFQIVGTKARFTTDVEIDGDLVIGGSLTLSKIGDAGTLAGANTADWSTQVSGAGKPADNADVTLSAVNGGLRVTGGGIEIDTGGAIRSYGATFATGDGFFVGRESGEYKFRVGYEGGARIEWSPSGGWNVVSFPGAAPTYALDLVNNETSNPIYEPTGGGTYTVGQRVNIVAPAIVEPGSKVFSHWSGVDSAVNALDSATANDTYATVIGDMTLYANYV